ncbi:MAG: 3-oxoacyl-[acyl-carrier-protein] reductase [Desulfobacterales bacterium]|nr:3-oxoacyl-[acyl-carrier-protein] reductase [Desulfobacterales bacterium]
MSDQVKRVVVITGGSRGIGRSICLSFAGPGTHIYFNYFSPTDPDAEMAAAAETGKSVAEMGGTAKSMSVNVASESEVSSFFKKIIDETGRIDVLVNNAGITKDGLLVRMNESDWDSVININLKGAFTCTKIAAKKMMQQRFGRIINMASIVGVTGNPGQANYVASKAGIIGLTKTAAKELASRGITVNAVAPGFVETDMTAMLPKKAQDAMLAQIPMGRAGKPEDIAAVVAFLASEGAAYITGQVIHVSGGMYI